MSLPGWASTSSASEVALLVSRSETLNSSLTLKPMHKRFERTFLRPHDSSSSQQDQHAESHAEESITGREQKQLLHGADFNDLFLARRGGEKIGRSPKLTLMD